MFNLIRLKVRRGSQFFLKGRGPCPYGSDLLKQAHFYSFPSLLL